MVQEMENYYKAFDHYNGQTCMLTGIHCGKDCTRCTFAGAAYAQAVKEKEKRKRKEGKE